MIATLGVEAERELIDAAIYYSEHGGLELGLAFIAEFERAIEALCEHPQLGPIWRGKSRRFPIRRFPYSIIYRLRLMRFMLWPSLISAGVQATGPMGRSVPVVNQVCPNHAFKPDPPVRALFLAAPAAAGRLTWSC